MKRVIRASLQKIDATLFLDIDVYYEIAEMSEDLEIAASVSKSDAQDFYEFVDNIAGILDARDFKIVENHKSNRKGSLSYYFSFYPTDEDGNLLDRFLINFRISDHYTDNFSQKSRGYYNAIAKEHKSPNNRFQQYRIKNIYVGKKACNSIHESLLTIEYICDQLSEGNYDALYNKNKGGKQDEAI